MDVTRWRVESVDVVRGVIMIHTVFVAYPLVPWIGVTAVGFGLGQLYA